MSRPHLSPAISERVRNFSSGSDRWSDRNFERSAYKANRRYFPGTRTVAWFKTAMRQLLPKNDRKWTSARIEQIRKNVRSIVLVQREMEF